jgi:hypothetical protein
VLVVVRGAGAGRAPVTGSGLGLVVVRAGAGSGAGPAASAVAVAMPLQLTTKRTDARRSNDLTEPLLTVATTDVLPPFGVACQSRGRTLVAQIQTMRKIT